LDMSEREQPLFREPDETLERPDAWSEPKGFLIGGWGNWPRRDLAQQYYDAATVLVEAIKSGDWEDYRLANPVLYLYRHFLELMLKDVLRDQSSEHNIDGLTERLEVFVYERHGLRLPPWMVERLHKLAEIDPGSTAFRYAEVRDKESKEFVPVPGEFHANLHQLQSVMKALRQILIRLDDA